MTTLNEFMTWIWVIFWLSWIISGLSSKPSNTPSNFRRFVSIRLGAFLLAIVVTHLLIMTGHPIGQAYFHSGRVVTVLGVVCFGLGLALAIWARLSLGKNWGLPMTQKQDPELVTSGPYHYVRHPIYSGILLATLGSVLAGALYWLVALIVFGVYFIYSAFAEEKTMRLQFPDRYPSYQAETKMLIPFIL